MRPFSLRILPTAAVLSLVGWQAALQGQTGVIDPKGDAGGKADVIAASCGYTADSLVFSATFAEGTLEPSNLGFQIGLDVDLDAKTGTQTPYFPVGVDFTIVFNGTVDPRNAFITGRFQTPVLYPVEFSTNALRVTVPLQAIQCPTGALRFTFISQTVLAGGAISNSDYLPDALPNGGLGALSSPMSAGRIGVRMLDNSVVVFWLAAPTATLERSAGYPLSGAWQTDPAPVSSKNGTNWIVVSPADAARFYRLRY